MTVMILDEARSKQYLRERSAEPTGRRREEVWDGVTFIMPEANAEHADLAAFFIWAFRTVFRPRDGHRVSGPINVSDRASDWTHNYRAPDVSLYLAETKARLLDSHWFGGPDFALEVVSPNDKSRDKLGFYAKVGTREVLILDRQPWVMELYSLIEGRLELSATTKPGGAPIASTVTPFTFQFVDGTFGHTVKIVHRETGQDWVD